MGKLENAYFFVLQGFTFKSNLGLFIIFVNSDLRIYLMCEEYFYDLFFK